VMIHSLLSKEVMFQRNPEARRFVLLSILKAASGKWRNMADKIVPTQEEFRQQQVEVAMQALQLYQQKIMEDAQITGEMKPDAEQLLMLTNDLISQLASPQEEQK